jgi:hypothetical protein
MKKKFLLINLFLMTFASFSQSLHILKDKVDVTNTVITIPITPGQKTETEFSIFNPTNSAITYQVNRTILNPPMNDSCAALYFCAGKFCFLPNTDITWTPKAAPISIPAQGTMPNGNGTFGIFAHYDVCPKVCNDLYVYYRVYNVAANMKDTAYVEIRYTCTNGIKNYSNPVAFISNAYPNPASSEFSLNYDLYSLSMGEILIQDIVGKEMQRAKLTDNKGSILINTSELPTGIYFYSLMENNNKICTKKLIIQQ